MDYIIFFKRKIITKCPEFVFYPSIKIGFVTNKYLGFLLNEYRYAIRSFKYVNQFNSVHQFKSVNQVIKHTV